jgi:ABC-type methionine transport system permease subunit
MGAGKLVREHEAINRLLPGSCTAFWLGLIIGFVFMAQENGFIVVHRIVAHIQKSAITVCQTQPFIVKMLL